MSDGAGEGCRLCPRQCGALRTPEAGGVTFKELLQAALTVIKNTNVVACDLVELAPNLDQSGASTATALKVMREMLLALEKPFIAPERV